MNRQLNFRDDPGHCLYPESFKKTFFQITILNVLRLGGVMLFPNAFNEVL